MAGPSSEAAGRRDHRCLELLLSHGARVAGTWALGAAVYADDAERWRSCSRPSTPLARRPGGDRGARRRGGGRLSDVVAALLDAGADPDGARRRRGLSALRRAVRAGTSETAALLVSRGAPDDSTDVDRFIGACLARRPPAAEQLLAEHPDLRDRLTDDDRAAIVEAAGSLRRRRRAHARPGVLAPRPQRFRRAAAAQRRLRRERRGRPLLLDAGADVDARDDRFDCTPLAFATVGSGEQAGKPGDWIGTVRLLVDAGASRDGVWISDKPPSEEVVDLLRGYGITPDDERRPEPDDERRPGTLTRYRGDGRHRPAPRSRLPRPRPRPAWLAPAPRGPLDRQSAEQRRGLDWYRGLLADGTRSTVERVEVDRDAVVLGLSVARQAEGARPAPPERLYQVFTVEDAQVTAIHSATRTGRAHSPVHEQP